MRTMPAPEAAISDYGRCQQVIRIIRLMQMVQRRTYLPPLPRLASQLGVCTRTVRRDLDVLRAVGVELPPMLVDTERAETTVKPWPINVDPTASDDDDLDAIEKAARRALHGNKNIPATSRPNAAQHDDAEHYGRALDALHRMRGNAHLIALAADYLVAIAAIPGER